MAGRQKPMFRPSCFVIQPFDKGKFDNRYDDVFEKALLAAGVEPLRVDRSQKKLSLIEAIEDGIQRAAICFVEITEPRQNVWYEFGYARALNKPLVIVSEKKDAYPFDVRHLRILEYVPGAPRDFESLGREITERARAALEERSLLTEISSGKPQTAAAGFQPHALACLVSIASEQQGDSLVAIFVIRSAMEAAGFNQLATRLALDELKRNAFIEEDWIRDSYQEPIVGYRLLSQGSNWLLQNASALNLRIAPKATGNIANEEPPF